MTYAITIDNISHSFEDNIVLDNISLKIQTGEILGLLGPSGAGKTTLIKILTGQLRQKNGYAELLNKDTRHLGALEHNQIGTMMDNFGLYERLSVYDNLAFYADIYRITHNVIDDILKTFGLYEARKTPVLRISKGMKGRLSLARALMNNPKILFLDEPTSGLDPVTTREIHNILKGQRARGTSIFLTTHNMFEAESLCDNVALLSKGKIIEYGKPEDISRKHNYLNKLQITLNNGEIVSLENDSTAVLPLKKYLESGMISSIHSTEPTLETVFVKLTGRGLE